MADFEQKYIDENTEATVGPSTEIEVFPTETEAIPTETRTISTEKMNPADIHALLLASAQPGSGVRARVAPTLRPPTAVGRTLAEMSNMYHDKGRLNRGTAFVKRVAKNKKRRAIQKATHKKMRKR